MISQRAPVTDGNLKRAAERSLAWDHDDVGGQRRRWSDTLESKGV